jgi:hypothetical protein
MHYGDHINGCVTTRMAQPIVPQQLPMHTCRHLPQLSRAVGSHHRGCIIRSSLRVERLIRTDQGAETSSLDRRCMPFPECLNNDAYVFVYFINVARPRAPDQLLDGTRQMLSMPASFCATKGRTIITLYHKWNKMSRCFDVVITQGWSY